MTSKLAKHTSDASSETRRQELLSKAKIIYQIKTIRKNIIKIEKKAWTIPSQNLKKIKSPVSNALKTEK